MGINFFFQKTYIVNNWYQSLTTHDALVAVSNFSQIFHIPVRNVHALKMYVAFHAYPSHLNKHNPKCFPFRFHFSYFSCVLPILHTSKLTNVKICFQFFTSENNLFIKRFFTDVTNTLKFFHNVKTYKLVKQLVVFMPIYNIDLKHNLKCICLRFQFFRTQFIPMLHR